MSSEHIESLREWRRHLASIQEFDTRPPSWVLPGLLPPGMTLLAGDPKTFKSLIALNMIHAVTMGVPFGDPRYKTQAPRKGTALYFAAEQSPGRIRYIYEKRVLRKTLPNAKKGRVNYDFCIVKSPWEWQIDSPNGDRDVCRVMEELKPTVTVIDPLIYFHSIDENDPQMVRPLVPLRQAALKYGGALVVVHHAKKNNEQKGGKGGGIADWGRVRGTSALWGMADAGILTSRLTSGAVNLFTEFKDHVGSNWTWRPGGKDEKADQRRRR